jgi:hypothetical protein
MDHARKPKLFAALIIAFIVLFYAAVAPLGKAQVNALTAQINVENTYVLEHITI